MIQDEEITGSNWRNEPLTRKRNMEFKNGTWRWIAVPIPSMYGIFTYIWLIFMVNVGKYSIHGSSGVGKGDSETLEFIILCQTSTRAFGNKLRRWPQMTFYKMRRDWNLWWKFPVNFLFSVCWRCHGWALTLMSDCFGSVIDLTQLRW